MEPPHPVIGLERRIFLIRGKRVMLDEDLGIVFGVPTKQLNRQVRRNLDRFPEDFMLTLTAEEAGAMRCHFGTSSRRNFRRLPFAFTEHGSIMLAAVLNSPTAVQASVHIVRAFVRLRELLVEHQDLARRLRRMEEHYDGQFRVVFDMIRGLMAPKETSRKRIGFQP